MVGDTAHDPWMARPLVARAAGMRSVAVTYGVHGMQELRSSESTWGADTFEDVLSSYGGHGLLKTWGVLLS